MQHCETPHGRKGPLQPIGSFLFSCWWLQQEFVLTCHPQLESDRQCTCLGCAWSEGMTTGARNVQQHMQWSDSPPALPKQHMALSWVGPLTLPSLLHIANPSMPSEAHEQPRSAELHLHVHMMLPVAGVADSTGKAHAHQREAMAC